MSERVARVHKSQSNRAKPRDSAERKVVFKSVVENPFRVQWPSVPPNIQNAVLACVVDMLDGVAQYNLNRVSRNRKRERPPRFNRDGHASKHRKALQQNVSGQEHHHVMAVERPDALAMEVDDGGPTAGPSILQSMTVGINEVTKELEGLARSHRFLVNTTSEQDDGSASSVLHSTALSRLVVACRGDVDPPILIGHLPNLIAACNSMRHNNSSDSAPGGTWLVPMSKGVEQTLAEAMGLRRVSVLLIDSTADKFSLLASLLGNIALPNAPWLVQPIINRAAALVPTHIKQLRTSAPKDMKVAKEKRASERAAAKARRREQRRPKIPKVFTVST